MKASFTRLFFSLLVCTLFTSGTLLKAQILEEIPNPPAYNLSWFSGGEGNNLFFNYFDNNFNNSLFNYDGMDLNELPIPMDNVAFLFYSHSYADNAYITVFDLNFNASLYEYDGEIAQQIDLPAGFTYGFFVAEFNDLMYIALYDGNFNVSLYQYDGTDMAEVVGPSTDLVFNNFVTEYDGTMWLTYADPATFSITLYAYDGTNYTPIGGLPDNISFMYLAYENETDLYLAAADPNFITDLYKFNGAGFDEIETPDGLFFSFISGENQDANELYINYFDNVTFNNSLYIYDGASLTPIELPTGFDFPNVASVFNGFTYISLFDNVSFEGALFKLDSGVLGQVDIPNNGIYSFHADSLLGEDYHIAYDQNFNFDLYKLDEANNALVAVEGPAGLTFNNFSTVLNDKMFVSYYDNNFFGTLFIYDGTEFIEIPNPANMFYSFFMTEQDGTLYLRYDNQNTFLGTLYKLIPNSLPISQDTAVTTDVNIPYFFQPDDFFFADTDNGDSLSSILITEIEQIGYLLWDGAHVYEGDIIPVSEIENLIFTPLQDETGNPYDAFRFRVGDGEAFSVEDYVMQINVIDPATSTQENTLNAFVRISPMPANTYTTIQLEATEAINDLRLYVFNSNGQMITQKEYQGLGNSFNETLQTNDWPVGNYYVVGRTKIGQFAKPMLIQR